MRLMKFSQLAIVGIFSLIAMTTAQAQATVVLAKVNGVVIPQSRLELMVKVNVAQGQPDSPEMRKALRENLITEEIIAQEAKKKGLDRDPEVITQLEISNQAVLVRAFQVDYIKNNTISDDTLRKEYEMLKLQMGDKEYKARHILVENESEAWSILDSLKKGADFGKVAAEKSIDEGSKMNGGELDWSPAAAYVRPFAEALVNLEKGKLTNAPVQTNFGWHVIQMVDIRNMETPPFEEIKMNMQQRVLQREFQSVVQDLRNTAKVE
ncbi:MAG: peptidylprolyl isomerase [Nitrosomonas sp.]|nr:peptidylprolyl isomerase [Nitrosomonas sp.]